MTFDLETQAYRCFASKEVELDEIVEFFKELGYQRIPSDDTPVYRIDWPDADKNQVTDAKFIVKKDDFKICCITVKSDNESVWKRIAKRIIKSLNGDCLVLSRNPSHKKWIFSGLSQKYSDKFSETRNAPLEFVSEEQNIQKSFLEFFDSIKAEEDDVTTTIAKKISDAFDNLAVQIHNELTFNVYEALKTLSDGIIKENDKLELNDDTLKEIRSPIFILLYRLIFILYAEDRGIFPVDNKIYYEEFSLKWIKEEWLLKSANTKLAEYKVQKRLKNLFKLIERGSEAFRYSKQEFFMRSYYGRIFDSEINSKLDSWKISNKDLIETLSRLTRTKDKKGNYFFLDYAALDTRHLGAVYEHLLEFHLEIKNNKIKELPNPAERKALGSYYTPKPIVDYIVKNSIEPLIDKIVNENSDKQIQIEKILELKILDPAMGSGHFLVGAIECVAKRLCKIEFGEITEEVYIERKRQVLRHCIYGIDINPLAVDLASLSLWLETISSEKPLSFLSSHLKLGNSLMGAPISGIFFSEKEKQSTLDAWAGKGREYFKRSVRDFLAFERTEDDFSSTVKAKLQKYQKMQSKGTTSYNLKFILDCKIAVKYGLETPSLGTLTEKIGGTMDSYFDDKYKNIKTFSDENTLFHWEPAFPEIFYDENGLENPDGGFDIVIGNPPYFNIDSKSNLKRLEDYEELSNGVLNAAALFIKKGIDKLRSGGSLGLIVPKSFLHVMSWNEIRKYVLENQLELACDVGRAFEDVALEQTIFIIKKQQPKEKHVVRTLKKFEEMNQIPQSDFVEINKILTCVNHSQYQIVKKVENNSTKLTDIAIMPRGMSVYSKDYSKTAKGNVLVLGGLHIMRFGTKKGTRKDNQFLSPNNEKIKKKSEIFSKERIIYQNIGTGAVGTLINAGVPTDDTVNNLIINDKNFISYEELLGIINSKLLNFYLRHVIINCAILTIHLDEPYLGQLPIKNKRNADLKKLVKKISEKIRTEPNNEKEIQDIQDKIDKIVYEMYELSDEEIKLVELGH